MDTASASTDSLLVNENQRKSQITISLWQFYSLLIICGLLLIATILMPILYVTLKTDSSDSMAFAQQVTRYGKEIVVAGQLYYIDTPVVLWMDEGGYDHYRVEYRFGPYNQSSWIVTSQMDNLTTPNRYDLRGGMHTSVPYDDYLIANLTSDQIEQVRGGGWNLTLLQTFVDQVVIHFDGIGYSKQCFEVLQDQRNLSIHLMLDIDGTIYQALDLKERARHATTSNTRSIGIEIANRGCNGGFQRGYRNATADEIAQGYPPIIIIVPSDAMLHTPNWIGGPVRPNILTSVIQTWNCSMYDYTIEQYKALPKLLAALATIFPLIKPDYPRLADGTIVPEKLDDSVLSQYSGFLGHMHVQTNKDDPGSAFQWDRVLKDVHQLLGLS